MPAREEKRHKRKKKHFTSAAFILLNEHKPIDRNYVHTVHADTHLLPPLRLDRLAAPARSPWRSPSPATVRHKTTVRQCVFSGALITPPLFDAIHQLIMCQFFQPHTQED